MPGWLRRSRTIFSGIHLVGTTQHCRLPDSQRIGVLDRRAGSGRLAAGAGVHLYPGVLFSRLLLGVRSKALLALMFCFLSAFLSAFLDALTVTAVIISAAVGFYSVYHRVASGNDPRQDSEFVDDQHLPTLHHAYLEQLRAFLRSLLMHGAVGTALGGVCTLATRSRTPCRLQRCWWCFSRWWR
jgi:Na+/H+ antiporter NhaB